MDKKQMLTHLKKKLGVDEPVAATVVNELLAAKVMPRLAREQSVEKIAQLSALDERKAEIAVNEFIGVITDGPAIFEEVIGAYAEVAVTNGCDRCRDCFNCGKEMLQVMLTNPYAAGAIGL